MVIAEIRTGAKMFIKKIRENVIYQSMLLPAMRSRFSIRHLAMVTSLTLFIYVRRNK